MSRCKICVMPDTRPDTPFIDGICAACHTHAKRPEIDWEARKIELIQLLDRHNGECIVPSSGGKDSTYQVIKLLELGAHVTVVTATTCHLTAIGRANIDNLARYATTYEISPNKTVRAKLNRLGLEMVGDISYPEHVSIFTTPFNMSAELGIPLIFFGENPQAEYGGPIGSEEAKTMTKRWRSEFGGFLGLRPTDLIGVEGLTARDMKDYMLRDGEAEAHFLGQYFPWDSHENAQIAKEHGMIQERPSTNNWWISENLDNAHTGLHDFGMYRKYGFGRGCCQISVDVRNGLVSRNFAEQWVNDNDGHFPEIYAGVPISEVLDRLGMSRTDLNKVLDRFTHAS